MGGLFLFWRREASRLRGLRGGFEGKNVHVFAAPNRPIAGAARQRRAPRARGRILISSRGLLKVSKPSAHIPHPKSDRFQGPMSRISRAQPNFGQQSYL